MIEPKEVKMDGKTYIVGKMPAVAGREILLRYPQAFDGGSKVVDYATSEELMFKLMTFVEVKLDNGARIQLSSRDLIDNHVPTPQTLLRLEGEVFNHTFGFFLNAADSDSPSQTETAAD